MDVETSEESLMDVEQEDNEDGALEDYFGTLFSAIKDFYDRKIFCDLNVFCRSSTASASRSEASVEKNHLERVECHALVLSSVVPSFKNLLKICEWDPKQESFCLCLPDVDVEIFRRFVDELYAKIEACDEDLALNVDLGLAKVLGLSNGVDYKGCLVRNLPTDSQVPLVQPQQLPKQAIPRTLSGAIDYNAFNRNAHLANPAKKNPFIKSKVVQHVSDLVQIVDGKMKIRSGPGTVFKPIEEMFLEGKSRQTETNGVGTKPQPQQQQPPVIPKEIIIEQPELPSPLLFADEEPTKFNLHVHRGVGMQRTIFHRIESLAFGFIRNMGVFRAVSQGYYTTPRVINDPENLMVTADGSRRQFRMKLPDKKFVALVAVGMRNGQNIAKTLAVKNKLEGISVSWPDENSLGNIVSMIKNICGTSYGVILRHPRCSQPNRSKISRQSIDRFKMSFKDLTKAEKAKIATECQIYIKEFDTVSDRIQLQHLPQTARKMEFSLATHLKNSEVMDYAILYGDDSKKFVIRSLFNFKYQQISDIRCITIMLDLLSCFLGFGNEGCFMDFPRLRETFDSYATNTCQNLAVQELGILSVDDEDISADLSAADIMADDTKFSFKTTTQSPNLDEILNLPPLKKAARGPIAIPQGRIPCNVSGCRDSFVDRRRLNAHVARMHSDQGHGDEDEPTCCVMCGKVLRNSHEQKLHTYHYHKDVKCNQCGKEFTGMLYLASHKNKVHYQLLKCDQCGVECRGRGRLKLHKINKHLEDHQKPFICSYCGKGYAEKVKLKTHQMNVHIRTRPYKCRLEGCKADFNCLANRNAHEKSVHKYDYKKVLGIRKSGIVPDETAEATKVIQLL